MKKIFLILLVPFMLYAEPINECQTDLYYANGVLMDKQEDKAEEYWKNMVFKLKKDYPILQNYEIVPKLSYNASELKGLGDFLEALHQWSAGQAITLARMLEFENIYIKRFLNAMDLTFQVFNIEDLMNHITAYKNSIKQGHGVIVVAHSQGNFFTNKAYEHLDDWMKSYFNMIGVASPAVSVAGGGLKVSWDNDIVPFVTGAGWTDKNPNRNIIKGIDSFSVEYHGFNYYMGEPVTINKDGVDVNVSTNVARDKIVKNIIENINKQINNRPSQWEPSTKNPQCSIDGCSGKMINGKHKYDSSINSIHPYKMIPFDLSDSGKVYYIENELEFVKAKCGGIKIEKPENEKICYELFDKNDTLIGKVDGCTPCEELTPTKNDIEVTLTWEDPNLDMDLSVDFPNGEHDIKDVICLNEHFNASKKGVTEGHYPVRISYKELEDNVSLKFIPIVKVFIKVPGGAEDREVDLNTIDALKNNGHIADIVVDKKGEAKVELSDDFKRASKHISKSETFHEPSTINISDDEYHVNTSPAYVGSSSGSWSIDDAPFTPDDKYSYSILWHLSQATAGVLANANIELLDAKNEELIYSTKSSVSTNIYSAGVFSIPQDITNKLKDNNLYILKASGGEDIDNDDDGVIDSVSTPNYGELHGFISGYELKNINPKINILTDILYHASKDKKQNAKETLSYADEIAKCLLKKGLNADKKVDHLDTLLWSPYKHKNLMFANYDKLFLPMAKQLVNGEDISKYVKKLASLAWIMDKDISVKEDVRVGSTIGRLQILCEKRGKVDTFSLSGDGANSFYIDENANIKVKKALVYEDKRVYRLKVVGKNSFGKTPAANLNIIVTADNSPIIGHLNTYAYENWQDKKIGSFNINDMGYSIEDIKLSGDGASNFEVSKNGDVKVAKDAKLKPKTYRLKVEAKNINGLSAPANIVITVYNSKPELKPLFIRVDKTIPLGTKIGSIGYKDGQDKVSKFVLDRNDSFKIDSLGNIYTNCILEEKRYTLKAKAYNIHGASNEVEVNINSILVKHEDILKLHSQSVDVYNSTKKDSIIAKLGYSYTFNPPKSFSLDEDSKKYFSIDNKGRISLKDDIIFKQNKTKYTLQVNAKSDFKQSSCTVNINILKDTPYLSDLNLKVFSNTKDTVIGKVAYSIHGSKIVKFKLIGEDNKSFSIDKNGYIKVKKDTSLDINKKSLYTLKVQATNDMNLTSNLANITIHIIDTAPTLLNTNLKVSEELPALSKLGNIKVKTHGKSKIERFVLSGNDAKMFEIDNSGVISLKVGSRLDYEFKKIYSFKVKAINEHGSSKEVEVKIVLKDIADTIGIVKDEKFNLSEDIKIGTKVKQIKFINGGDKISKFILSGDGSEDFKIDEKGNIYLQNELIYPKQNRYRLFIQAKNSFGLSKKASLNIDISRVYTLSLQDIKTSIKENIAIGSIVGKTDIVLGKTALKSIKLTGDGADKFSISKDGVIKTVSMIDYEKDREFNLKIVANDKYESVKSNLQIKIIDIPDVKPILKDTNISSLENNEVGNYIGKLNIKDIGDTPIQSFKIKDNLAKNIININKKGEIYSAKSYDYEDIKEYNFKVVAINKAGSSNEVSLVVRVGDIDENPPKLLSLRPKNGDSNIFINTHVMAIFDENIVASKDDIVLRDLDKNVDINGSVIVKDNHLIFKPQKYLDFLNSYEISLKNTILDKNGNSFDGNISIFKTQSEEQLSMLPKPIGSFDFNNNLLDEQKRYKIWGGDFEFVKQDKREFIEHKNFKNSPLLTDISYGGLERSYRFVANVGSFDEFILGGNCEDDKNCSWFINLNNLNNLLKNSSSLEKFKLDLDKWYDIVVNINHFTGDYEVFIDGVFIYLGNNEDFTKVFKNDRLQLFSFKNLIKTQENSSVCSLDLFQVYDRFLTKQEVSILHNTHFYGKDSFIKKDLILSFEEQFNNFSSNKYWKSFGYPLPRTISNIKDANGSVWDNNGDSNYESGSVLKGYPLEWNEQFVVEFRLKQLNADAYYWLYSHLGITTTSEISESISWQILANFEVSGGLSTNGIYKKRLLRTYIKENSKNYNKENYNDGDWHIYKIFHTITNNKKRYISIYIDDVLINQNLIKNVSQDKIYVLIRGRSMSSDSYLDYIKIFK